MSGEGVPQGDTRGLLRPRSLVSRNKPVAGGEWKGDLS